MATVDWAIVALYFLASAVIGIAYARRGHQRPVQAVATVVE